MFTSIMGFDTPFLNNYCRRRFSYSAFLCPLPAFCIAENPSLLEDRAIFYWKLRDKIVSDLKAFKPQASVTVS